MIESKENRRAGREEELRKKLKAATERYESVFNAPLTVEVLKDFLDYSQKQNKRTFLIDRIGVLSDIDCDYLKNVLKENVGALKTKASIPDLNIDDVDAPEEVEEFNA